MLFLVLFSLPGGEVWVFFFFFFFLLSLFAVNKP